MQCEFGGSESQLKAWLIKHRLIQKHLNRAQAQPRKILTADKKKKKELTSEELKIKEKKSKELA